MISTLFPDLTNPPTRQRVIRASGTGIEGGEWGLSAKSAKIRLRITTLLNKKKPRRDITAG